MPKFKNVSYPKIQELVGVSTALKLLSGISIGIGDRYRAEYFLEMDFWPVIRTDLSKYIGQDKAFGNEPIEIEAVLIAIQWCGEEHVFAVPFLLEEFKAATSMSAQKALKLEFLIVGLCYSVLGYVPKEFPEGALSEWIYELDRRCPEQAEDGLLCAFDDGSSKT